MAKYKVLTAVLLLSLAGCSDPQPTTETPATDSTVDSASTAPVGLGTDVAPGVAPAEDLLLPPGVTFSTPVHQRSMHGYTTQAGQERRVLIYEFMDGDITAMAEALERDMGAAGFSARAEADRADGKTRITFLNPGFGRVNATLVSDLGDKPDNPNAQGVFSLDVPLEPAPDNGGDAG